MRARGGKLKAEGLTQAAIGEKIGWSAQKVSDYSKLLDLSAQVLILAKERQEGRADKKSAVADFLFTEGWFRNSGLYDLDEQNQIDLMQWFIDRISTKVLEIALSHQKGRVDNNSTVVEFTERWFRDSGLYDLDEQNQRSPPCPRSSRPA